MSVNLSRWHDLLQSWPIRACYLFLSWRALQAVQPSSRVNNMLTLVKPDARMLRPGSVDGTWYTQHNDTTFVAISEILTY